MLRNLAPPMRHTHLRPWTTPPIAKQTWDQAPSHGGCVPLSSVAPCRTSRQVGNDSRSTAVISDFVAEKLDNTGWRDKP